MIIKIGKHEFTEEQAREVYGELHKLLGDKITVTPSDPLEPYRDMSPQLPQPFPYTPWYNDPMNPNRGRIGDFPGQSNIVWCSTGV